MLSNNQHVKTQFNQQLAIAFKELNLFFASPIGYLFLAAYIAATLFIFFWGESFFSRNIADVRPMFEWMPVILIFLCAALTMRMWSDERRSGTLEHVLTLPINTWQFVLGKFSACKTLLVIALVLTLPLPITISLIANLDWGPVVTGYVATMALGSAYISIGLFVSARSDNQIVSLIITCLLCGVFYFLGSDILINLVSNDTANTLRALGSGSRFESITRGVLDMRDIVYYVSIVILFLALNRYSLEKDRWAKDGNSKHHKRWRLVTALIAINAIALNIWLTPISALRLDTTAGKIYSISDATKGYLDQLQEPLLIRGYFSEKTHPLLAPLVPQLQDLLKEYQETGGKNVRVDIIDPATDADAEEDAGSKYGIKPVPFRIADRYQSAVVNSYFNVLIKYGDEYKVLGFQELIDVKTTGETDINVQLGNPEYDITNAIKQVLYAYQSGGNLFDNIKTNLKFSGFISSSSKLPVSLAAFTPTIEKVLQQTKRDAKGKFAYTLLDPDANGGNLANEIVETYGFQPMASSLFDTNTFYYYLVLKNNDIAVQIPLPEEFTEDAFKRSLDSALKRFAKGFTKTIGFVAPKSNPYAAQMGQPAEPSFNNLQQFLNENATAKNIDLSDGHVPDDIDLLMVMAPSGITEKSLYAIDQFLMKGGTVITATSNIKTEIGQQGLSASEQEGNLNQWLQHHGVNIGNELVMDTQSLAFPIPVDRQVGMFTVQEMKMLDYPYFINAREKGLNQKNPITSGLPDVTIPWASPIHIDTDKNTGRSVVELVNSSPESWLSSNMDINPGLSQDGNHSFIVGEFKGPQLLAASVTGRFNSYFFGKPSPLLTVEEEPTSDGAVQATKGEDQTKEDAPQEIISAFVEHSPESARLIVVSSNNFAEDRITSVLGSTSGANYVNPIQMLVNASDWSLEDEGLLSIRARSYFNRTLPPMDDNERQFWEVLNYVLALFGLGIVFVVQLVRKRARLARYQVLLDSPTTEGGATA